jgi:hypothetical protein
MRNSGQGNRRSLENEDREGYPSSSQLAGSRRPTLAGMVNGVRDDDFSCMTRDSWSDGYPPIRQRHFWRACEPRKGTE